MVVCFHDKGYNKKYSNKFKIFDGNSIKESRLFFILPRVLISFIGKSRNTFLCFGQFLFPIKWLKENLLFFKT